MAGKLKTKQEFRTRRHFRIRKKVVGSAKRPRLFVFRSAKHIYAQLLDDQTGLTLACASTLDPAIRSGMDSKPKKAEAAEVGKLIAERAQEKGITQISFDRGGYLYHGRIQSLADAARESGLEF